MRSVCRGKRFSRCIPAVAAFGLVCACGGEAEGRPEVAPRAPARWAALAEAKTWELVAPPFPSKGHAPHRFTIAVRVDAKGLAAYRAAIVGAALPEGTRIAAFHETQEGEPASVYFMSKANGAWTFGAADAAGALLRGSTELCAACHGEAAGDGVFGIPRR